MKSGNLPHVDIPHASRGCMRLAWYGVYALLTAQFLVAFLTMLSEKRGTSAMAAVLAYLFLIGCGELLWRVTLRVRKKRMIKTRPIMPMPARPAEPDLIVLKPVAPTEKLHR